MQRRCGTERFGIHGKHVERGDRDTDLVCSKRTPLSPRAQVRPATDRERNDQRYEDQPREVRQSILRVFYVVPAHVPEAIDQVIRKAKYHDCRNQREGKGSRRPQGILKGFRNLIGDIGDAHRHSLPTASLVGTLATGYCFYPSFGITIHRMMYSSPPVPANKISSSQMIRRAVTFQP